MGSSALIRFLDLDIGALELADIAAALDHVVAEAGFDFYTLTRHPQIHSDPFGIVIAGRWPLGWPEHYVRRKYATIDPTIRYLGYCQHGFSWREAADAFLEGPHARRVERMMADARRFGLGGGYVFPVHGRQGLLGLLSVGGSTVPLAPSQISMLDAVARKALLAVLDRDAPPVEPARNDPNMTRREMEALSLLAQGLTSNEMGTTLGLSAHTVDWYMNGIQSKLDARNRHHAVAIAFRRGLIS